MGRVLAIDYGDVRTGLALSDPSRMLASGLETVSNVKNMQELACYIADVCRTNQVVQIVVGLPLNMDDSEGPRCVVVREFAALLGAECDLPIHFHDERCTSILANEILAHSKGGKNKKKKRKAVVDTLSAQIILQDYLDN